jgi:hypothetical protein
MPYIRYFGGRPPSSIAEHVTYEDPNAPCKRGLAELMANGRRFAEETCHEPTEKANALEGYLNSNPYPGLEHVGGIGLVQAALRPIDEEITAIEYQRVRGEVLNANREYRERSACELAKNNNPQRRASSEHESLGWRTRVWITSFTEMDHHVAYALGRKSFAYMRVRDPHPSGLTAQLFDIYHPSDGGAEQALLEGLDYAELLVDLLALSGYGAAGIGRVLGTTVPYCRMEEEFQLATYGASIFNTPIPVSPDQFGKELTESGRLALRHLRDGLSASIPTLAFSAFWNLLERQAEEEARLGKLRRMVKCQTCGAEREEGWNLKSGFEAMYTNAGIDPSLFNRHRSRRGSIQHGAKAPTTSYLNEVFQDLAQIQVAAVVAAAKEAGIMPGTATYLSAIWPIAMFSCRAKKDRSVDIQFERVSVRAGAGTVPQRIAGNAERAVQIGMEMPAKIDPLSLPPIQE